MNGLEVAFTDLLMLAVGGVAAFAGLAGANVEGRAPLWALVVLLAGVALAVLGFRALFGRF